MKTYFSRLAGQFENLCKIQTDTKGKLVIGCIGALQAHTINAEELNYLISWYVSQKYKIEDVEVLSEYHGISKYPPSNYNSFLKITYEPIKQNIPESEYFKIRAANQNFQWNHNYKEAIITNDLEQDVDYGK